MQSFKSSLVPVLVVTVLVLGGPSAFSGDCLKATVDGAVIQYFGTPSAQGLVELTIGGVSQTATMIINVVSVKIGDDGTQVAEWDVTWDLDGGNSFGGIFHGVLSPVALPFEYWGNGQGKVVWGEGDFEDVLGKLVWHGPVTIYPNDGYLEGVLSGKGKLCFIAVD